MSELFRSYPKTSLPDKLEAEIEAAIPGILDTLFVEDGSVTKIFLKRVPSSTEEADLVAIVNNHVPVFPKYKLWDFVIDKGDIYKAPLDVDYKKSLTTRLHPKNYFTKGELTMREYYENAQVDLMGNVTFSNLILKEENVYTRDPAGFAVYRTQTISWIRDDESIGPEKKTALKYYAGIDKIQEGKKRRANLVDALMMRCAEYLIINKTIARRTELQDPNYDLTLLETNEQIVTGRDYLTQYGNEFSAFISHSDKLILTATLNDSDHSFLDQSIPGFTPAVSFRDFIISEMTI